MEQLSETCQDSSSLAKKDAPHKLKVCHTAIFLEATAAVLADIAKEPVSRSDQSFIDITRTAFRVIL